MTLVVKLSVEKSGWLYLLIAQEIDEGIFSGKKKDKSTAGVADTSRATASVNKITTSAIYTQLQLVITTFNF